MPISEADFPERFGQEAFPSLPCPSCSKGRISLVKGKFWTLEAGYSVKLKEEDAWEPDWRTERFTAFMQCAESACGESVVASGIVDAEEELDEEYGWVYASVLKPQDFYPAPRLIPIPENCPEEVQECLKTAFRLFWSDLASCVNKIRISMEALLDHLKVPRRRKTASGKIENLTLHQRIVAYAAKDAEISQSLMAIKMVGNLGSHDEGPISRDIVFNVLNLYEDALEAIFDHRKKELKRVKAALIKSKGKSAGKKKK
ncbi:MAG: DUF4145 domain-containing protein [Alphaproteobacteria bacterium]|nr:DUF4145 domain-containing protein [Alphaproteobacteria bacterium]